MTGNLPVGNKVMNWKFWKRNGAQRSARPTTRQTQVPGLPGEEEREAAYLTAPGNKLFQAIIADLREFSVEVSDRGLDAELSNEKLRWHNGGADALLEFLEKLEQRERDARLTQEQLEAKKAAEQEPED